MLNFGSYNYLGFSENNGPCSEAASDVTHKYGIMSYGSRQELGKCARLIYKYIPLYWIPGNVYIPGHISGQRIQMTVLIKKSRTYFYYM